MSSIELFVGFKIPDTTAITAFHTIEKLGYSELKKLKREIYYKFYITGNADKFSKKIAKTDILVNANKNNYRVKKEGEQINPIIIFVCINQYVCFSNLFGKLI